MFTVTLNEAPEAYTTLRDEFKSNAEISSDGKTITVGEQTAHLKRRMSYSFWTSARWEVPYEASNGPQDLIILIPEQHKDTVIDILANKEALKALKTSDVVDTLKASTEASIVSFKCV